MFFIDSCQTLQYSFAGDPKNVIAIDTRKKYNEIDLGERNPGDYEFNAPYKSDWAVAVE
jgi:hypothetical protein